MRREHSLGERGRALVKGKGPQADPIVKVDLRFGRSVIAREDGETAAVSVSSPRFPLSACGEGVGGEAARASPSPPAPLPLGEGNML